MKSYSDTKPPVIQNLGDGNYHYNYEIKEKIETDENGNEKTGFEYETVLIAGQPTYEAVVPAVIAEKYNASKETSLLNKHNAFDLGLTGSNDEQEYVAYLRDVFAIKKMVKQDLNG